MRIIGGQWRGRKLDFPDALALRPTANRVRETLFNWLGQRLDGQDCLDLFAGSGALGFEAASRGARSVCLVESNPRVIESLQEAKRQLSAEQCEIVRADANQFLGASRRRFDVVFVDPPFESGQLDAILKCLPGVLKADGRVYVEWGEAIDAAADPDAWSILRQSRAGVVHFALLQPTARSC
ncbi:MAG TPA: 16S rRNA (guanine(966)-N(2))-methyltransferase RsmD [Usitatibacteraceae bacterium]|nr:16S rRNA (guanine(966)-N(2))-methyltransferase RsmD [Usitatibacteraceae bacterium]